MKLKNSLACLFIVAAFPVLASLSPNHSAPLASVAFAGHSLGGGYWCACGSSEDCICDPRETPNGNVRRINPTPKNPDSSFDQSASPVNAAKNPGLDFGSSALMMALAILVWARFLRA